MEDKSYYPEGNALVSQIATRHRWGAMWRTLFLSATIIAIIILMALLYNVFNSAFGLVAVQNSITPESLVLAVEEEQMLGAENTFSSEDDNELVAGIANDPNAIGFFGYAYYQNNADQLKAINVNGMEPSAETAANGQYSLARPLYIYTTADIMESNSAVNTFINYIITHVDEEIETVGYFPADMTGAETAWLEANELDPNSPQWPVVDPAGHTGSINIAGSSTVYPVIEQLAGMFEADGYPGNINLESVGSTAGLRAFCVDGTTDIANASRPIKQAEITACKAIGRDPIEIRVGTDALAVVVSAQNEFLTDATDEELRQIFTDAQTWNEVNASWPSTPIQRYVPGADSGTLDFFAETVFNEELADLPTETLVDILKANISVGLGRRLEREQLFIENKTVFEDPVVLNELCVSDEPPTACTLPARTQEEVYLLVLERVVVPEVVKTWSLVDSFFRRDEVLLQAQQEFPKAEVEFRSWLTPSFITSPQSSEPELAGVRTAIIGSLWVIVITIAFSFPIGVGSAIYLEEYAQENRLNRLIQTNINNLAGVPSIIYGMLGLAIFVRVLERFTSGAAFGLVADTTTANGRTIISAGLTLGLLILPIIIINSQEAIRAVPSSLRQASYGLGATKWQTIWNHVLPNALPGILTGTILSMSRAIGETAPLVVVGASTFITVDPSGPFSKFTVLPIQIYQWTSRPQDEFRNIAAAAIIVLLVMLLTLNATAVLLRNRYSTKMT
jgi:phosphate transport system permease protein